VSIPQRLTLSHPAPPLPCPADYQAASRIGVACTRIILVSTRSNFESRISDEYPSTYICLGDMICNGDKIICTMIKWTNQIDVNGGVGNNIRPNSRPHYYQGFIVFTDSSTELNFVKFVDGISRHIARFTYYH